MGEGVARLVRAARMGSDDRSEQRVDARAGLLLWCVLGRWCHQRALPVVSAGAEIAPVAEC